MCPARNKCGLSHLFPAVTQQQGWRQGKLNEVEEVWAPSHPDRRSALVSVSLSPPATSLLLLTCLWSESTLELGFFGNKNKHVTGYRGLLLALMSSPT